jgi:hypothetical protein
MAKLVGTFRTWRDVGHESVMRSKADIGEIDTGLVQGSEIEPWPSDGVGQEMPRRQPSAEVRPVMTALV